MLPPQHHLVTGPHFAPIFPAVATHCGGSGGNLNSTSLPNVMGDCFQLYCQTVFCLILPSARMNSFNDFCVNINLLFRSFYLHFMDPSRGPRCGLQEIQEPSEIVCKLFPCVCAFLWEKVLRVISSHSQRTL